ncbi:MAG: type II toxin-antitoxin system VapC family toxin [Betaproteobacteria bacterium]
MILFCDTSALVKLYVEEPSSAELRALVHAAEAVAACRIAYAEARAAFARRGRESAADSAKLDQARAALTSDWPHYLTIEVTQPLVQLAGDYADVFALRAYDSVQLAAARTTAQHANDEVGFACFDHRLNKAAAILGLTTHF